MHKGVHYNLGDCFEKEHITNEHDVFICDGTPTCTTETKKIADWIKLSKLEIITFNHAELNKCSFCNYSPICSLCIMHGVHFVAITQVLAFVPLFLCV